MQRSLNFEGVSQQDACCSEGVETPRMEHTSIPTGLMTPPSDHPSSKLRKQGSKTLSTLRSLTNSASGTSSPVEITPPPSPSRELGKRISMSFMQANTPDTVVHRSSPMRLLSPIAFDGGTVQLTSEASPVSSGEASVSSGQSSNALRGDLSTAKTSLDSRFSLFGRVLSGQSSENRKMPWKALGDGDIDLQSIQEASILAPKPKPTAITVEKATAAKIFFETYYNDLLFRKTSPRSMRRRQLEGLLYNDVNASVADKDEQRRLWALRESEYLRELRVMKSRPHIPECPDRMVSDYEVVKVVGKGSFGVVRLVREKEYADSTTGSKERRREVYAMKVIRKADMLRNSQEGHLRAERDFLVASEGSRWIVPLVSSFQDTSSLYLVMEYMPGGDFLGLLIRDNILSEAATKWYIAEMILCVEEAHSLRWIHRDIKPDNFLISASGHLKISDFGLAFDGHWSHDQAYFSNHRYSLLKHLGIDVEGDALDKKEGRSTPANMKAHANVAGLERHEKNGRGYLGEEVLNWRNRNGNRSLARSVVGTSQYMAPEIIRGEQYDGRCDWWGVAIILFECLYGHTPFVGEEGGRQQTKLNILHKTSFAFPLRPIVSSRCQDLICNMIQEKENRLCSRKYDDRDRFVGNRRCRDSAGRYVYPNDAEEIKKHRWFKEIDWENLHLKTPPFVPSLKGWDDTQYFDEEEPISDFSATQEYQPDPPTEADLGEALRGFSSEVQMLARGYVSRPYDSVRLRRIEREIDNFAMTYEQRHYLRSFIKLYGRKERKRPRDRLLRDGDVGDKVLEIRKRSAFLGYSYRRIRRSGSPRGPCPGFPGMPAGSGRVKKMGHKPRLTIL